MTFAEALVESITEAVDAGGKTVVFHLGREDGEPCVDEATCPCGPIACHVGPAVELDVDTYFDALRLVRTCEDTAQEAA